MQHRRLVIVNLQQTPYDKGCALRIFATADEVLRMLAAELQLTPKPLDQEYLPQLAAGARIAEDVLRVPFDGHGSPCDDPARMVVWDLRVGQRVRLTGGPYEGDVGTVVEKSSEGHYRIRFCESMNKTFNVARRPFSLWLGSWWLQQATHGLGLTPGPGGRIPFVNVQADRVK